MRRMQIVDGMRRMQPIDNQTSRRMEDVNVTEEVVTLSEEESEETEGAE